MTFTFRLRSLLNLRENTRDERRTDLAQAYRAERLIEEEQDRIKHEQSDLKTYMRVDASPGTIPVDRLLDMNRYETLLLVQSQGLEKQREQLTEEIDRRRDILVEAEKEVRVLEKLRDRQREEYSLREQREYEKMLDEVASRRHQTGGRWS